MAVFLPLQVIALTLKFFCVMIPVLLVLGLIGIYLLRHLNVYDEIIQEKSDDLLWQPITLMFDPTMTTDEEKVKLTKLLQGLEVPEVKLTDRCRDVVKLFHDKFIKEVEEEMQQQGSGEPEPKKIQENPYKVDKGLLEENERKLRELLAMNKRAKKEFTESIVLSGSDPKRPWRTNSSKEKLFRIDNELKRHQEVTSQAIAPMTDEDMRDLVKECQEETQLSAKVSANRLRDTVDAARKNLPNFQYKKIDNGTATAILAEAHDPPAKDETPKL